MTFINDEVFDGGLDYATTNGDTMELCNADPGSNYTLASSTYSIGTAAVTTSVTSDGASDGRKVTTSPVTAGTIDSNDTATHWALTDGTSVVIASGALDSSVAYTTSEKWTLEAITIAIRDAGVTADITLSGETVAYNQNPTAYARIKIDNDGNVYRSRDTGVASWQQIDTANDWCRPTSSAPGAFRVKYDINYGTVTSATVSEGTWRALSDGDFQIYNSSSGTLVSGGVTLTIDDGLGNTLATGEYILLASNE